ncbi:MAG TPA: DUF1653 domain-containing protein [Syntrophomonadaceae bacterium]|nr:DUF1653 domain-containing protein [Syntrophomonadaceae bacterium]
MRYFILNGPTASGKSVLMNYLLHENNDCLEPIVSFTTRPPKAGERPGKDYYFISSEEYLELRRENRIVEQVKHLDWEYGVTTDELQRVENTRKNGIAIMNLYGIRKMKRNVGYQKVISIFVYRDLSAILESIKELDLNSSKYNRRIEMVKDEMRQITACDHVVYNTNSLSDANQQLLSIIQKEINARPLERKITLGQKYKHFSGECCEIISDLAEHTETVSPMVIYRSLKTGLLYARPYEVFCSKKEWPPKSGTMVNRFELLEP